MSSESITLSEPSVAAIDASEFVLEESDELPTEGVEVESIARRATVGPLRPGTSREYSNMPDLGPPECSTIVSKPI